MAVLHSYVDKGEMNKGVGDVVNTQEMIGDLIAGIIKCYSTVNNLVVERVL
jgi:hypothetical protein